jgi:hypothetical protein
MERTLFVPFAREMIVRDIPSGNTERGVFSSH